MKILWCHPNYFWRFINNCLKLSDFRNCRRNIFRSKRFFSLWWFISRLLNYIPYALSSAMRPAPHPFPYLTRQALYALPRLTCLVPWAPSRFTRLVLFTLPCLACPVPHSLSCVVLYPLSCLTCPVLLVFSCLTYFLPYALSCDSAFSDLYNFLNIQL